MEKHRQNTAEQAALLARETGVKTPADAAHLFLARERESHIIECLASQ